MHSIQTDQQVQRPRRMSSSVKSRDLQEGRNSLGESFGRAGMSQHLNGSFTGSDTEFRVPYKCWGTMKEFSLDYNSQDQRLWKKDFQSVALDDSQVNRSDFS